LRILGKVEHKPRGHEKKLKFMQGEIKINKNQNKRKGQYKGVQKPKQRN